MADSTSPLSPAAMAAAASAASMSPLHDPHSSNHKLLSPARDTNNNNNYSHINSINNSFEQLTAPVQFFILATGVFFFFGIHNYLQEAIMSVEGFQFGVMLGYLEVLGVTVCSFVERRYIQKETQRVAPLSAYPLLTFCLMSSSSLSNLALNYINFPTKVYVCGAPFSVVDTGAVFQCQQSNNHHVDLKHGIVRASNSHIHPWSFSSF